MAYNLTLTDGSILKVLNDNTVDSTTTSINLVGRNYSGYGALLNQNFIKILENFSSGTSPVEPLAGQLWWDKLNNRLNVYVISSGYTGWRPVSATQIGPFTPISPEIGTLWWDTGSTQLKAYSGTTLGWLVIGPNSSTTQSIQGNTVIDYYGASHIVGNLIVNNKLTAIFSSDSTTFRLPDASPIGGLSNISPGINFTSATQNGMLNSPGFRLGVFNSNVDFQSLGAGNSIRFSVTPTIGSNITALLIDGTTGLATVSANASANFGIPTKVYVDSIVQVANARMKSYVDTANTAVTTNLSTTVTTANTNMKAYVDDRIAGAGSGTVSSITFSGGSTGLTPTSTTITTTGTITLGGNLQATAGGTGSITYSIGDMLYADKVNPAALKKLTIGANDTILYSNGTIPSWTAASSIKVGKATSLFSSIADYSIPYQLSNLTQFLTPGIQGQVLTIGASGQLTWVTPAAGGGGGSITVSVTNTNTTMYPLFWNTNSGTTTTINASDAGLKFNPATGNLTATSFTGSAAGLTSVPAGELTGTIPSAVLTNSSLFVGTTSINLARASSAQTLTGISIDGTAGKATNIVGGAANRIPYQTGVDATSFITAGTAGQVLVAGTGGLPGWGSIDVAGGGTGSTSVGLSGTIAYSDGTKYVFTGRGTAGQVLTSQGSSPPTWTTVSAGGSGTVTSVSASVPSFLSVSVSNSTTTPAIAISYSGATQLPVANGGTGASTLTGAGIVTLTDAQTISGAKTFSGAVTLNGTTTATTQLATDNSTKLATTAYVQSNFDVLKSIDGYQKIAQGIWIQWGRFTTASTGQYSITFPVAFPTACTSIYGTYQSGGDATGNYLNFAINSKSTATAYAYDQNGQTGVGTYGYLAIGY